MIFSEKKTRHGYPILTFAEYDDLAERQDVEFIEDNGLSGSDRGLHWYTCHYVNREEEDFYTEDTEF